MIASHNLLALEIVNLMFNIFSLNPADFESLLIIMENISVYEEKYEYDIIKVRYFSVKS